MIGRVQYLEKMGLATPAGPGEWMVVLEAERSLRDLGMRGDIIKTMHRVFTERGQDRGVTNYVIDAGASGAPIIGRLRSEEHTSELQSLMRISYAVFCLKKKNNKYQPTQQSIS